MQREHVDVPALLFWYEPMSNIVLFEDETVSTNKRLYWYVHYSKKGDDNEF